MKREKSGVIPLLIGLLLFSISVGFLYGDRTASEQEVGLATMSPEKALTLLMPLVISDSDDKFVEALKGLPFDKAKSIMALLMKDHEGLSTDDVLNVLFGTSIYYEKNQAEQFAFFDLILSNKVLHPDKPLLFIAAQSSYPQVLPSLYRWLANNNRNPVLQPETARAAYRYAVEHTSLAALQQLSRYGIPLESSVATDLLWLTPSMHAVEDKPEERASIMGIVAFLIQHKADINNARAGYTPLIKAVEQNNEPVVKALVEQGAAINRMVNPEVGTALQQTLNKKQLLPLELYLREKGARE